MYNKSSSVTTERAGRKALAHRAAGNFPAIFLNSYHYPLASKFKSKYTLGRFKQDVIEGNTYGRKNP